MRLYIVEFGYKPRGKEKSIIVAENMISVMDIINKKFTNVAFEEFIEFVDKKPKKDIECFIKEVNTTKKGIIYTGYYCC